MGLACEAKATFKIRAEDKEVLLLLAGNHAAILQLSCQQPNSVLQTFNFLF